MAYSIGSILSWANHNSPDQFLHEYLFHQCWRGGGRPPTKVQAERSQWEGRPSPRVGRTPTEAKLAHLRWVTSFGLLEWAYAVLLLGRIDLIWVCPCSPLFQALILLVSGPSPLGIFCFAQYGVILCFFVHFECIFYVFHEYPPANDQTPKLVEIVISKP